MILVFVLCMFILSGCNNNSMRGIDDGLTVIGVILAIMVGAYYIISKIWINTRKKDKK